LSVFGCKDESNIYTLYRNSPLDNNMRLHIATFDSANEAYGGTSESYNKENCLLAVSLFQAQPNVVSRFWCEKGRYKK
jgi:hypothetical protein